jgi:hypothetical protein
MARAALLCIVPDGTAPTDGTQPRVAAEHYVEWPVGDSGDIEIAVQHADGSAYDLTGCALTLVCRRHAADAAPALAYEAVLDADPTTGLATVTVLAANTAAMVAGAIYWFDVRLVAAGTVIWHILPASKWVPTMTVARANEPAPAP